MSEFDNRYSDAELEAEFDRLFPHGFAGADVLRELAPAGWAQSPLVAVFHPSVEQVYAEAVRVHHNLNSLPWRRADSPAEPNPTREEIARDFRETPIEVEREVRELVGQCLWDVFSDSHDVIGPDDRPLHLGSFRGSGEFLADTLNRQIGEAKYDYMDFYMGTSWVSGRADLTPVYQMIFRRLKQAGLDWIYHFPRLYALDLRPLQEAMEHKDRPEWEQYDPSAAVAKEADERDRERDLCELRDSLDEGYRQAVSEAIKRPPPPTVRAYEAVYGRWPRGWPPEG
jgi:hypothetical protein